MFEVRGFWGLVFSGFPVRGLRVSGFSGFWVSRSAFGVRGFAVRHLGFVVSRFRVSGSKFWGRGFRFLIDGSGFRGAAFRVQGCGYAFGVSFSAFRIDGFGFHYSGFRGSGFLSRGFALRGFRGSVFRVRGFRGLTVRDFRGSGFRGSGFHGLGFRVRVWRVLGFAVWGFLFGVARLVSGFSGFGVSRPGFEVVTFGFSS